MSKKIVWVFKQKLPISLKILNSNDNREEESTVIFDEVWYKEAPSASSDIDVFLDQFLETGSSVSDRSRSDFSHNSKGGEVQRGAPNWVTHTLLCFKSFAGFGLDHIQSQVFIPASALFPNFN